MEELQARHRREQKDLQAKITQKKKAATKKTKKGVKDECATLEQEIRERQAAELAELNTRNSHGQTVGKDSLAEEGQSSAIDRDPEDGLEQSIESTKTAASGYSEPTQNGSNLPRKPNRQKARLARRAVEQDALAAKAAEEAANMPNERESERIKMLELFEQHELKEYEIRADGHCLYSAIADQMNQLDLPLSPREPSNETAETAAKSLPSHLRVRHAAADYITANSDEFSPFLEEPLEEYIHNVRDTGEWGGQLELAALANAYGLVINVLQANGRVEKIVPQGENGDKQAWLAYYRHGFGLGEHYNSLRKGP